MSFLRFSRFSRLKYFLVVILALQVSACLNGNSPSADTTASLLGGSNENKIIKNPPARSLNLSWVAPSQREDGSALSLSEIAGYRIYYGTQSGNYPNRIDINDGSADQAQIVNLPTTGSYYVVLTTIDVDGRESSYSSEVVVNI